MLASRNRRVEYVADRVSVVVVPRMTCLARFGLDFVAAATAAPVLVAWLAIYAGWLREPRSRPLGVPCPVRIGPGLRASEDVG